VRARLMRGWPLGCLAAISVIAFVLAPTAAAAVAPAHGLGSGRLALVAVSNPRPELVSGGEVLVRVGVGKDINPADVQITSDGQDVTSSFNVHSDGSLLGLVTGLAIGRNRLVASAGRRFATSLDLNGAASPVVQGGVKAISAGIGCSV
jgi:uncharacterized tannase-like protein DUF6351